MVDTAAAALEDWSGVAGGLGRPLWRRIWLAPGEAVEFAMIRFEACRDGRFDQVSALTTLFLLHGTSRTGPSRLLRLKEAQKRSTDTCLGLLSKTMYYKHILSHAQYMASYFQRSSSKVCRHALFLVCRWRLTFMSLSQAQVTSLGQVVPSISATHVQYV